MKKILFFSLMILFLIAGCTSMEDIVKDSAGGILKDAVTSGTSSSGSSFQKVDFKEGELLVAHDGRRKEDATFNVSKVITAPSSSSKNQGEFLFIRSGEKIWSPLYYESRVASKNDLELGMYVFYCGWGTAGSSDLTQDRYRESYWYAGRITDLEELFKDVVIIDGKSFQLGAVRVPIPAWD